MKPNAANASKPYNLTQPTHQNLTRITRQNLTTLHRAGRHAWDALRVLRLNASSGTTINLLGNPLTKTYGSWREPVVVGSDCVVACYGAAGQGAPMLSSRFARPHRSTLLRELLSSPDFSGQKKAPFRGLSLRFHINKC